MLKATGGVPIALDSDETYGHFDILDEAIVPEVGVMVGVPSIVIATGTLPALAVGKDILVDNVTYRVLPYERVDDGMVTRIYLKEI
jgi:hypothetical protein